MNVALAMLTRRASGEFLLNLVENHIRFGS